MSEIVFEREHLYVSGSLYLSSYSIDCIFLLFPFLSLSYPSFSLIFSVSITLTHSLSLCRFASVSYLFITLSLSVQCACLCVSPLSLTLYLYLSLILSLTLYLYSVSVCVDCKRLNLFSSGFQLKSGEKKEKHKFLRKNRHFVN